MAVVKAHHSTVGEDFLSVLAVVNAQSAAIAELQTQLVVLLAKLDDDAGVTDTNYEATVVLEETAPDTVSLI